MTAEEFKKALKKVYEKDLDKIIDGKYRDWTKPKSYISQEKRRAKRDKALLDLLSGLDNGIEGASFIAVLNEIKSAEVLKNVFCYMLLEKKGDN